MPLNMVEVGKQFRPKTSQVYPPFKHGRYLEEYVYDYFMEHGNHMETAYVYIPVFWTNLQNHPGFSARKDSYQLLLDTVLKPYPPNTVFFTVVQHDDGPQLSLPKGCIVFGACTGTIPLPLIYEDVTSRLQKEACFSTVKRDLLASFIGTSSTSPVRQEMIKYMSNYGDIVCGGKNTWSHQVAEDDAERFIRLTLRSRFCLAPRGYGRSSFRFFEAMLLGAIPVYIWDDIEWLPYKDVLDYSTFAVSIQRKDLSRLESILRSFSEEKGRSMIEMGQKVSHYFTLEGMCQYMVGALSGGASAPTPPTR